MRRTGTQLARLLLVEGSSDERIVRHICKAYPGLPSFDIRACGGWSGLRVEIRQQLVVEGRMALGIMADANSDRFEKWGDIAQEVSKAPVLGSPIPSEPEHGGTVLDGAPKVGVWLMPDNQSSGELEDFVATLIPDDDPIWPLAREYIQAIPAEHKKFSDSHTVKAQVYAWTAALRSPGGLLSAATQHSQLSTMSVPARTLVDWIQRLFE